MRLRGARCAIGGLRPRGQPCDFPPLPEALGADLTVPLGGEEVAALAEVIADGGDGLEEALGVRR